MLAPLRRVLEASYCSALGGLGDLKLVCFNLLSHVFVFYLSIVATLVSPLRCNSNAIALARAADLRECIQPGIGWYVRSASSDRCLWSESACFAILRRVRQLVQSSPSRSMGIQSVLDGCQQLIYKTFAGSYSIGKRKSDQSVRFDGPNLISCLGCIVDA